MPTPIDTVSAIFHGEARHRGINVVGICIYLFDLNEGKTAFLNQLNMATLYSMWGIKSCI